VTRASRWLRSSAAEEDGSAASASDGRLVMPMRYPRSVLTGGVVTEPMPAIR
jgi:hypothetical protein